jgi:hypothetical protein
LTCGTDGYIKIDDPSVWNLDSHFEPLLAFFCLPYNSYDPKLGKRREIVDRLQRLVSKPDVPPLSTGARRDLLCKLLREALPLVKEPGALGATSRSASGLSQFVRRSMTMETN